MRIIFYFTLQLLLLTNYSIASNESSGFCDFKDQKHVRYLTTLIDSTDIHNIDIELIPGQGFSYAEQQPDSSYSLKRRNYKDLDCVIEVVRLPKTITEHEWIGDILLYFNTDPATENNLLYALGLEGDKSIRICPEGREKWNVSISFSDKINKTLYLTYLYQDITELYQYDIQSQHFELLRQRQGSGAFYCEPNSRYQFVSSLSEGMGEWSVLDGTSDIKIITMSLQDMNAPYFVQTPTLNESTLYKMSTEDGQLHPLITTNKGPIVKWIIAPDGQVLAYRVNYLIPQWVVKEELQEDFRIISAVLHGRIFDIDTKDGEIDEWVVKMEDPHFCKEIYVYRRLTQEMISLTELNSTLRNNITIEAVEITARDGLVIPCYMRRPQITGPIPFVIDIHGGPQSRERYEASSLLDRWANAGIGSISLNFRGSNGFGEEFEAAGIGQWHSGIYYDILDVRKWLIRNELAPAHKIAIHGASFGGYAVNWAMTQSAGLFCCGISRGGDSDLISVIEDLLNSEELSLAKYQAKLHGYDIEDEGWQEVAKSRSPLTYVENMQSPLLLVHGTDDQRVKVDHSHKMFAEMARLGKKGAFVLAQGDDHTSHSPINYKYFEFLALHFLTTNMGVDFNFQSRHSRFAGHTFEMKSTYPYFEEVDALLSSPGGDNGEVAPIVES